jgi:hypothetical protein
MTPEQTGPIPPTGLKHEHFPELAQPAVRAGALGDPVTEYSLIGAPRQGN